MRLFSEILNEKLIGNKYYLSLSDSIENIKTNHLMSLDSMFSKTDDNTYILLHNEKWYNWFLKNIDNNTASYSFNYIYKITKPAKIFIQDNYHFEKLIDELKKKGIINDGFSDELDDEGCIKTFKEYYTRNSKDFLTYCIFHSNKKKELFRSFYDGFLFDDKRNEHYFFWDFIKNNVELVDGIIKRFRQDGTDSVNIPSWVLDELKRYTTKASRKIDKEVIKWCKENLPRKDKVVFRGIGFNLVDVDYFNDIEEVSKNEDKIMKKMKKFFGINNLDEIQVGNTLKITRGKESSWSVTPQVSIAFMKFMRDLGILFKMKVKASDIIIDFTELPASVKKDFDFSGQNEVIIDTGKYQATIDQVVVNGKLFEQFLELKGFIYKKNRGIFKR